MPPKDPGVRGLKQLTHDNASRLRTLRILTARLPGESEADLSNIGEWFNDDMRHLITQSVKRKSAKTKGK